MLVAGTSALAVIAVGFALEKLFFEQWPWWAWATIALFAGLIALLVSNLLPNLEDRQADLPVQAEIRLQRIKLILSFLDRNMFFSILPLSWESPQLFALATAALRSKKPLARNLCSNRNEAILGLLSDAAQAPNFKQCPCQNHNQSQRILSVNTVSMVASPIV